MAVPSRKVDTEWGTLYATTDDGATVRFSTTSRQDGDPERHLMLSRLWYSADVYLTMRDPKRLGRCYSDGIWHADLTDCCDWLRRYPAGGTATVSAQATLCERVVPDLAAWLSTNEGISLLSDGSAYRQAERITQAGAAEQVLEMALGRVTRMHRMFEAGFNVGAADLELLRHVNDNLGRVTERANRSSPETSSAGRPAPTPPQPADRLVRSPEPPGL